MTPADPAAAVLRTALADGTGLRWVHAVSTSAANPGGSPATAFVSDDGPAEGTQQISVGAVSGDIRVVGMTTYVRGSSAALVELFDLPEAVAAQLGGRWVTLRPGDSEYDSVTVGVTISSFLQEIAFSGPVSAANGTLDGRTVTVVRGALAPSDGKGSGILYVSATTRPLPLEWIESGTDGTTTTAYSRWGRAVAVTAPAGAAALPVPPGGSLTL